MLSFLLFFFACILILQDYLLAFYMPYNISLPYDHIHHTFLSRYITSLIILSGDSKTKLVCLKSIRGKVIKIECLFNIKSILKNKTPPVLDSCPGIYKNSSIVIVLTESKIYFPISGLTQLDNMNLSFTS